MIPHPVSFLNPLRFFVNPVAQNGYQESPTATTITITTTTTTTNLYSITLFFHKKVNYASSTRLS